MVNRIVQENLRNLLLHFEQGFGVGRLLEPPSGLLLQQGQQRPGVRGAEQGLQPLPVLQQLPGPRDLAENIWVVLLFLGRSSIDLRYEPERCGIPGHPPPSTVYGIP